MTALPPLRDLLDPQPEGSPEVLDAVRIPFDQIESRTHELGPNRTPTRVAAVQPFARLACEALERVGRAAELVEGFAYGPSSGRLWAPTVFLEDWLQSNPRPDTALDIACGSGRDAVLLASSGWRVTAVDHHAEALLKGRDLQRRYAAGSPEVDWRCGDAELLEAVVGSMGGTPMPRGFGLVAIFRYLDRDLLGRIGNWLAPEGVLLAETFTSRHRERFGKPSSANHLLEPNELPRLLDSRLDVGSYEERDGEFSSTARLVAVRKNRE